MVTTDDFSFAKFSMNTFYGSLNARLVDMVDLGSNQRIVDMACGTGAVTRLILERLRGARDSVIIALDQSATGLKQAMDDLKDVRDSAVEFVQSRVEHMSEAVKESVDTIFYCNAIHYITDKDALVAEVSKVLKPGGRFAFNTSFFEGGQTPESRLFYRKWMLKSSRILRKEYGLRPTRAEKVQSRKHLTVEEYRALVERHGLRVVRHEIDSVNVPIEGWLDISTFEDFITGIMPGVQLDKASDALRKGLVQTFDEMKIRYVSRNWLDVLAVRI